MAFAIEEGNVTKARFSICNSSRLLRFEILGNSDDNGLNHKLSVFKLVSSPISEGKLVM